MRTLALLLLLGVSSVATADCGTEQNICEATCSVKHLTDDAAAAGCKSKCIAKRALCSSEEGAEKAVDLGKSAWEDTKSFIKGVTD
ncbi:MAG: hypothetical protein ACPGPF_10290 [Pontibacterium sp.]